MSKQHDCANIFMEEFYYWTQELNIPCELTIDNRYKKIGACAGYDMYENPWVTFCPDCKGAWKERRDTFIIAIFHELGHIKYNTHKWRETYYNKVESEYLAETFCLRTLKKYFPRLYEKRVATYKDDYECLLPSHHKAFSKIKEYN